MLRGDRVVLSSDTHEVVDVPAREIVRVQFKDANEVCGVRVASRPSDDIPRLKFKRFPPLVIIRVRRPSEDLSLPPQLSLVLRDATLDLPLQGKSPGDQVIVKGAWYPVAEEQIVATMRDLSAIGVTGVGELTVRQYLDLLRSRSTNLEFVSAPAGPKRKKTPASFAAKLHAHLYPYQDHGARWLLRFLNEGIGCILGDEMGLGKTLQVIAALCKDREKERRPTLVLAPTTLLENWRREFARFDPSARVLVHRGPRRTGFPSDLEAFDVVLTSYETAVRDQSLLGMLQWRAVVADEAQAIKNPETERAVALRSLKRHAAVAMTGTPMENRLRDLWALSDFVAPGYLGAREAFERSYEDSEADAVALGDVVKPLILRRLVKDVAKDLPPRIDIPQALELGEAAEDYDKLRSSLLQAHGASAQLVALTRLRQYCAHPSLLGADEGPPEASSVKYARLLELVDEIVASGEKVLVFAPFQAMLNLIASDVGRRFGVPATVLDGTVPVPLRQQLVDEFSAADRAALLALNPRAGGAGLNIAAANHVIHYAPEWNPAVEDQATARAYRRGQTRPVTVHRLYYVGTVEEYMSKVSDSKRRLAKGAVTGTTGDEFDLSDVAKALALSPLPKEA
jgi:SNF2 family DNA or RNA helicase